MNPIKKLLHTLSPRSPHFIPSHLYCPVCKKHVSRGHEHPVYALGGKKPRKICRIAPFLLKFVRIPNEFDLCDGMPPNETIEDQEETGACVSFAWAYVIMWFIAKKLQSWLRLSQEFIYDVGRSDHGAFGQAGMESVWGAEVLANHGTCELSLDKYQNTDNGKMPSQAAYDNAKNYMTEQPGQCQTVEEIEQWMYQKGPMCMGIPVYASFMNAANGVIPFPQPNEALEGYHELCLKGVVIINGIRYLKFENSWYLIPAVLPWGDKGYGYYPEDLLASDLQQGQADAYYAPDNSTPPDHVCPSGQHWDEAQQKCVPDAPTDCYSQDMACQQAAMAQNLDFWGMFMAKLGCMEQFFICYLGLGEVRRRINASLGKNRLTMTKTAKLSKIGVNISVTITKPKNANW